MVIEIQHRYRIYYVGTELLDRKEKLAMKISALIEKLEKLKETHGDLDVILEGRGGGPCTWTDYRLLLMQNVVVQIPEYVPNTTKQFKDKSVVIKGAPRATF